MLKYAFNDRKKIIYLFILFIVITIKAAYRNYIYFILFNEKFHLKNWLFLDNLYLKWKKLEIIIKF